MNWKKPLVFGIFYMLILAGCAIRPSEEEEKNSFEAAEEFTKVFNMAVLGSSTHDSTQVLEYIETEEGGKVLKELLQEDGIDPEAASSQCFWWGVGLPGFYKDCFKDGDILLLRNYGDFASNLLDWLIPSMYTHCGVLKQQFSQGGDPTSGCVLSASIHEGGITYQTWAEWNAATSVTRMRVRSNYTVNLYKKITIDGKEMTITEALDSYKANPDTEYAFVYPDTDDGEVVLKPVPNIPYTISYNETTIIGDPVHWHCSKVTWWLYYAMGYEDGVYDPDPINPSYPDIENNDWYLPDHTSIPELKTFGFYKLYKAFLKLQGEATDEDEILGDIIRAITLVAIPDEIRFATSDDNSNGPEGTEGGPLDPTSVFTWGIPECILKFF